MKREPVLIAAVARVVIYIGASFGVDISEPEVLALIGAVETISLFLTRRKTVPVGEAVDARVEAVLARLSKLDEEEL